MASWASWRSGRGGAETARRNRSQPMVPLSDLASPPPSPFVAAPFTTAVAELTSPATAVVTSSGSSLFSLVSAAGTQAQRYCYARAEERTGAGQRGRPEAVAIWSWQPVANRRPSQPLSQLWSQPPNSPPSQPWLHDRSHEHPWSCRPSRAPSTPPMMFVNSFDSRSESSDGSPQPSAEESIAKRTSTLNIIALSCQRGSFASMHSAAGGGSRRREAGWQEAGRRMVGQVG